VIRASAMAFGAALLLLTSAAAAQEERAAMLQTAANGAGAESVGSAFDRLARTRFERLAPMPLDAAPPLPLEDLQLAVGCVGESADCLRAVAERVGVQVMVVPSLELSNGTFVASFLLLDTRDDALRRVTRRADSENELFERVDPMLRELFDLPPPEAEEPAVDGNSHAASPEPALLPPASEDDAEDAPGFPVGPAIVGGGGLAIIAGGLIAGGLAMGAQNAYAEADTSSRTGVDAAQAHLSDAQTDAAIANVLFAVGGAAMIGAVVWWLVGADSPFGVSASPEGVALSVHGSFGGDS